MTDKPYFQELREFAIELRREATRAHARSLYNVEDAFNAGAVVALKMAAMLESAAA
jgi:hypothetical protein